MTSKFPLLWRSLSVLLVLLASCTTMPAATETPTAVNVPAAETLPRLPTPTPYPFGSPVPFPTQPNLPLSTATPTQTPLPTVLPKFPLDGYVVLFSKDGDLYFQDGETLPVRLAHIEGNVSPPYFTLLSSDNQKVVFYQDDGNIYSINTDGTQEQIIIPSNWFSSLETGTFMGGLGFVPETHIVFFETMLCKEESSTSLCSTTIFIADTDTGKIRKLADLGLALQNHDPFIQDNIRFSPDGNLMAVGTTEGVRIFTLDGKIIRQNILPFTPSGQHTPLPSLFWLPDSSGLIMALPNKTVPDPFYVSGFAPAYTIWRYLLDGDTTVQIPFDPPVAGTFEVSPDGNWIVYGGISPAATRLYLGNLVDGSAKDFGDDLRKGFQWSSDSKHFIHGSTVVISFDKLPLYGGAGPEWVDPNHFVYFDIPENSPLIKKERFLIAEIRGDEVYYYELGFSYLNLVAIRPKQ